MKNSFFAAVAVTLLTISCNNTTSHEQPKNNIYNFTIQNAQQESVNLKDYEGKVLLVVNTASHCGFTPQYEGLEKLYKAYNNQGFEILDFPCNQFGEQAPENDSAYVQFCKLNYHTEFQQFHKIEVNGENEHPLYKWLKAQNVTDTTANTDIKWNFTKFLIDQQGNVVKRYESGVTIEDITPDIKSLIDNK